MPPWPRYEAARDDYLELEDEVRVGEGLHTAACDLWTRVVAERLGDADAAAVGGGGAAAVHE